MSPEHSDNPYRLDDWQAELDPRANNRLLVALAEAFGAQGSVLDIGTGTGHLAHALAAHHVPVVALDVVDWRSPDVDLPFALGESASLPVADAVCGGVHMARMLQHVVHWQSALAEMARVLQPGGTVCLSLGGWLDTGPLRDVQCEVVDEAERLGVRPAPVLSDLRDPDEVDTALTGLGLTGPELIEVTGTMVRTPREAVAELVGRTDRWQPQQDFRQLYEAGATVLGRSSTAVDEAMVQQQHISYRVYRSRT